MRVSSSSIKITKPLTFVEGKLRHEGNCRLGACHHHHHHHHHHQTIVCLESVQSAVTADFAYQRHFCSMQIIRMKLCKMVNAIFFSLITIAFFCTFFFVRLISSIMCVLEVYFWCSSDITTVHCRCVSILWSNCTATAASHELLLGKLRKVIIFVPI